MYYVELDLSRIEKKQLIDWMCGNMARIYDLRGTSEENVKEDLKSSQYT